MPEFRILSIFNRYLQYGGEETMAAKIAETLSQKALVREYNYSTQEWLDAGKFTAPFRGLKNRHVIRQLRLLQREYKFDFWLIHNVFPAMSPAVYREARRLNVPVIHMLHNYRFGCLNGLLFREGRECRECLKGSFLPGVKNRCWQGKLIPSLYSACFQTAARKSGILHNAARFIALSGRHAELLKATGIPEEKTSILPLFVETHLLPYVPAPEGGDILFVGRLTPEKGLMPVLQAWERLDTERRLVIAGDGPQRQELENWVKEHNARNILFKGFVPLEEQEQLWNTASASIAPSAWQEAGATTILESLGRGRPVIAFAKGAACDHLANPLHGWLMNPDDPGSLTHTLQTVLDTPAARINVMGEQCRAFIREYRSPESWLGAFMEIAEQAAGPGSLPEKHTQES